MGNTAISISGLTKSYGSTKVVDDLSLEIVKGEVFALLGPNGAGKTTTVEILEAFRARDSGQVSVLGVDPAASDADWRARLGVVLQESSRYEKQSVAEVLAWYRAVFPNPLDTEAVLSLVGLSDKVDFQAEALSGGQRRRLDVACGITGRPELLFLDEPTTGLDPEARRQVWHLIKRLSGEGTTILLTTHYLDEVEFLADRVGVIIAGRLVSVGPLKEFGGKARHEATIRFRLESEELRGSVPSAGGQLSFEGEEVSLATSSPTPVLRALLDWAKDHDLDELVDLKVTRPSLEDLYLELIAESDDESTSIGETIE